MPPISLSTIKKWVDENDIRCLVCGHRLYSWPPYMQYYPHDGGIEIQGMGRLWIYFVCPNCGYQNALWKLLRKWKLRESKKEVWRRAGGC